MKTNRHAGIHTKIARTVGATTAIAMLIPAVTMGESAGTAAAATQGDVTKSESVYANTDSTGKTEQETVTDWLHDNTSGAVIADRSQLSDIINIKGSEKPQISGNSVSWTLTGNDLYYQGKTQKQLPVSMTIRYFLNGKAISPSELAGKSGKFEMKLSFQNRDAHTVSVDGRIKTVYTPFACIAAFNLPNKNFQNVATNFGNVLSDGNNQAVSFVGFPGLKQSFDMIDFSSINLPDELDVTADASDFTLGPIMMAAVPVPDMDSLKNTGDLSGLAEKLNQLIDAGAQLRDATGTLSTGEKAFAEGVGQLLEGVNTAGASFDQIVKGAGALSSAVGDPQKGVPALTGGANRLASGAGQVSGGVDRLYRQFGTGTEKSPTLKDSIGSLNSGAQQLAGGLGQLLAQLSPATSGQSATLYDKLNALNEGASQYASLTDNTLFGMVEVNLQTLRSALSSAMTPVLKAQGMSDEQIASAVKAAVSTAVSQEAAGLHGTADAALIRYLSTDDAVQKAAYLNAATEYINLYDILNIIAADPAVVSETDPSAQEAAFEQAMESAVGTPSPYLYGFEKDRLSETLAAASLTADQQSALQAAAASIPDAALSAAASSINGQNIVLAGAGLSEGTAALAAQLKTAVSGQSATLYDSVKALNDGARQLESGTGALADQTVTSGDSSHPSLYDSIGALDSGAKSLASGAKSLATGASGLGTLQSGLRSLSNALGLFRSGLTAIGNGTAELNDNSAKLADGTTALNNGMARFWNQGLEKLQTINTGKMEQALAVKDEMIRLADGYTSFTGTGDGIKSNVKFILKTDEIKVSPKQAAQVSGSPSAKSVGFWQKIVNWFKNLFHAN